MSDYNKAIEMNSNYYDVYNNRGIIYAKQGNFAWGLSDFTKAIKLKPQSAQAYNNRAFAEYFLKKYDESWIDVRKVESLSGPIDPHFIKDLVKASGQNK